MDCLAPTGSGSVRALARGAYSGQGSSSYMMSVPELLDFCTTLSALSAYRAISVERRGTASTKGNDC
jgi:hypothetical protein